MTATRTIQLSELAERTRSAALSMEEALAGLSRLLVMDGDTPLGCLVSAEDAQWLEARDHGLLHDEFIDERDFLNADV